MKKQIFWLAGFFIVLLLFLNAPAARAHESITAGNYEIVVGWINEPPYAGQMNGIEIQVSDTSTQQPVENVSGLTLTVSYGGQTKTLTLEAVDEHTPGHFAASLVPAIPGEYTVRFGGTLGETAVDAETEIHEVQSVDTIAFPRVDSAQPETTAFGITEWLAIAGFVSGLAGLFISLFNMRNRR